MFCSRAKNDRQAASQRMFSADSFVFAGPPPPAVIADREKRLARIQVMRTLISSDRDSCAARRQTILLRMTVNYSLILTPDINSGMKSPLRCGAGCFAGNVQLAFPRHPQRQLVLLPWLPRKRSNTVNLKRLANPA